jgi:hypothetical protein
VTDAKQYVQQWRTDSLQWVAQTVEALSCSRNNTGCSLQWVVQTVEALSCSRNNTGCSLQWVAQTVEALSYSRNNTGSIPDRTKRIFCTWNFLVQFSLHKQRLSSAFLSFGRLCVILHYQRDVLLMAAKLGNRLEPTFTLWAELHGIRVGLSSCVQRARCWFS